MWIEYVGNFMTSESRELCLRLRKHDVLSVVQQSNVSKCFSEEVKFAVYMKWFDFCLINSLLLIRTGRS